MEEDEVYYIDCIGIDRKLHVCEPHETKTKCGIPILKKNPTWQDRAEIYSCGPCTY